MNTSINILSPGVTHTFKCDILPHMIRTGTIADGSCFFHALFFAISKDYCEMSTQERVEFVMRERHNISNSVSLNDLKTIGNGNMYRLFFIIRLREYIQDESVLEKISNTWNSVDVNDIIPYIRVPYIRVLYTHIPYTHVFHIEYEVLELWKKHLLYDWVDETFIEFLQHYYKLNFMFINANNRQVYKMTHNFPYSTFILFLWIREGHYESLGQIQVNQRVRRQFSKEELRHII